MNRILRTAAIGFQLSAFSLALPAAADTVHLANGNDIEGILLEETPERVEVQFAAGGSITFHRDEILSIEASDDEAVAALRERWAEDREQFQAELKEQEKFDAAQREKGLIRDGGEWVSRDEYAARTERQKVELAAAKADSDRAAAREAARAATAAAPPAARSEGLDLSRPVAPPLVVSYPFWDWRGQPVYRTFPVANNRPAHRRQHQEQDPVKRAERLAIRLPFSLIAERIGR